jgi:hypothetical protein
MDGRRGVLLAEDDEAVRGLAGWPAWRSRRRQDREVVAVLRGVQAALRGLLG